jgi:hypothetical protein
MGFRPEIGFAAITSARKSHLGMLENPCHASVMRGGFSSMDALPDRRSLRLTIMCATVSTFSTSPLHPIDIARLDGKPNG